MPLDPFLPLVDAVLSDAALTLADVDQIAVGAGPDPPVPGRRAKPVLTLLARHRGRYDPLYPASWPVRRDPGLNCLKLYD